LGKPLFGVCIFKAGTVEKVRRRKKMKLRRNIREKVKCGKMDSFT